MSSTISPKRKMSTKGKKKSGYLLRRFAGRMSEMILDLEKGQRLHP